MMRITFLAVLTTAAARPSYIAVPADQIAFVDLTNLHVRVPRQTLTPPPENQPLYSQEYLPIPVQQVPIHNIPIQNIPIQQYQQQLQLQQAPEPPQRVITLQQTEIQESAEPERLAERPPDFGEYVDFGAHTGDSGAFGWYADYPINNHADSNSYRK